MKSMFRSGSIIVFVCCLSAADCLQAQAPADTLRLDAVDITARPSSRQTPGATATEIDSAALHSACVDAAELLRMNSNAFIKSYSHAGSATLSVRGTEARHTAVLWHGMNINSPSMGITDVSLMPLTGISTMRLLQGGVASVYGNSSLGGTLILEHAPPSFDKSISLSGGTAAGSFSTWNAYGSADISGSKVQSVTGIRISGTANDFEFTDITKIDKPVSEQQHGSGNGMHITQDLHLRTGTNGVLTASAWYLTEKRNIPATMMEDYSTASQRDSILRTVLSWKKHFKKLAAEFSGAYFDEHQHYQDSKHQIDSKYNVRTWQGIASFAWQLSNKTELTGGANYIYNRAAFEEYADTEYRKNLVVYGGITHIPTDRIRLAFNFRKEFTENENPPFCPSIHLEADLLKSVLTFHASAAQNYSLPSMNDLYWQPGGNSELLPEESLSFECGLKLFRERPGKPEITATVYKAVTKNWIKWIPVDAGYYAASNLDEVETQGIELQGSYRYNRGKHSFFIHAGYAYTLASRTATAPENENLLGNQLIYTPRHSGVMNLSYSIFMWEIRYDQQYTGLRYTTEDHSSSLDAFTTADLKIARNLFAGKMNYSVFIKVMNLWDEQYQVMAWRPMPGRWIMAGVSLQHIGKLKKQ